jgi:hypothetical protein
LSSEDIDAFLAVIVNFAKRSKALRLLELTAAGPSCIDCRPRAFRLETIVSDEEIGFSGRSVQLSKRPPCASLLKPTSESVARL